MSLTDRRGTRWLVERPTTRRERARGLLGRTHLPHHHGMLLERTSSIHTFGMRFPIAAVLLDQGLCVLGVKRLRPRRLLLPRPGVRHVLECSADANFHVGDVLVRE